MKNQALFSSKDKSKKLKCRLLQFLFGALLGYIYFWPSNFLQMIYKMKIIILSPSLSLIPH